MLVEVHIFLTTVYGGLVTGFIYDIYRTIRYLSKPKKIITYLGDLIFWMIAASIFIFTLIKSNWGEIRGYIFLAFFLGNFIYIRVFSPYIYPICIKFSRGVGRSIGFVISAIFYPFALGRKKLSPILKKIKKTFIIVVRETKRYKKIISSKK